MTFVNVLAGSEPECGVEYKRPDRRRAPAGTTITDRLRSSDRMTDSAVPPKGVATPPPTRITREGDGYVVSCACLWLKYAGDEQHAAKYRREHEKTCAKCKAVAE